MNLQFEICHGSHLSPISYWTNLKALQITRLPFPQIDDLFLNFFGAARDSSILLCMKNQERINYFWQWKPNKYGIFACTYYSNPKRVPFTWPLMQLDIIAPVRFRFIQVYSFTLALTIFSVLPMHCGQSSEAPS